MIKEQKALKQFSWKIFSLKIVIQQLLKSLNSNFEIYIISNLKKTFLWFFLNFEELVRRFVAKFF